MHDGDALLAPYLALSAAGERLLAAARAAQWDAVAELEPDYTAKAEAVAALGAPQVRDRAQAAALGDLIRKLMADEAALRTLLQPRLAELSGLLSNTSVQRKLADAYRK